MPESTLENQSNPAMPIVNHRVLSADQRGILKRAQGNAYNGSRVSRYGGLRMFPPPEGLGYARACQFIAGDPGVDASTCGKRSRVGTSYCARHHAVCYGGADPERAERGRKAWETRRERYGKSGTRIGA